MQKSDDVNIWRHFSRYTQGLILIMVSILFFGWGLLGQAKVDEQTEAIIKGMAVVINESHQHLQETEETLIGQTKYFTCILRIHPTDRTPRRINRCERQAGLLPSP